MPGRMITVSSSPPTGDHIITVLLELDPWTKDAPRRRPQRRAASLPCEATKLGTLHSASDGSRR